MDKIKQLRGRVAAQSQRRMTDPSTPNGSLSSISPSELDKAIRVTIGMGNVDSVLGRCKDVLRGDSITISGKRKQICRIVGAVLIPIALLCGMTASSFLDSLQRYVDTSEVRQYLYYSLEIGNLLHHLQAERDKSCLYVSDFGPENKKVLINVYPVTYNIIENMTFWLATKNGSRHFRTKEAFLKYLNQHRYSLDLGSSVKTEINFYSDMISEFITWLYEAVSESRTGIVWKSLVGYQEVILAREAIGKERSLGVVFYARGRFGSRRDFLDFAEAQDTANATFSSARLYAPHAEEYFESQLSENSSTRENMRILRIEIKKGYISKKWTKGELTEFWYTNMTVYLDAMLQTQRFSSRKIGNLLDDAEGAEMSRVLYISSVFAVVVFISPLIACAVFRLTTDIQRYSTNLVDRSWELYREKRLTDSLLHQMLPKSVSRQLRYSNTVPTEMFEECTICFSDIHGFRNICSHSTPRQVVDMLSMLYNKIDFVLGLHDVYKVATIGDACMIASGIPKRNGKRHTQEIISVAMDILKVVRDLNIPHFHGTHFKMRLGCHTGPVVAGVIGVKMPRYSLYGETVHIANKMEALGKAGMIHISQTTHDILAELDDNYQMVLRNDAVVSRDRALMDVFKGRVRTYWVLSDGRKSVGDCTDSSAESSEET